MTENSTAAEQPNLLLVDDDETYCEVLARALCNRGFNVQVAHNVDDAMAAAQTEPPEYALVDLNMPGASGLKLVSYLKELDTNTRTVVLTGYASVATAVEAIKLGAIHYLPKPSEIDAIIAAFHRDSGDSSIEIATRPMSVNRLEWEHIQKVLSDCDGNISEASRRLNMHRRTLQRKLKKRPMKE